VIRFSAALVVVAIGVLIGGVAASNLLLVYLAVGMSALALLILAVGVLLRRDELFSGDTGSTATGVGQQAVSGGQDAGPARVPAAASAGTLGGAGTQPGAFAAMGAAAPWNAPGGAPSAPGWAPGAWPPPEPGFPAVPSSGAEMTEAAQTTETGPGAPPAAPHDRPSVFTPSSRRRAPMAPPTRADPVVPWADSLPTRIDVGKDASPEPAERVPGWLADVDDDTLVIPVAEPVRQAEPTEPADAEITRVERIIPAEDTRVETEDAAVAGDIDGAPDIDDVDGADDGDADEAAGAVHEPADAAVAAGPAIVAAGPAVVAAEPEADSRRVTVVPGVPRYHDEDCILVRFLDHGDVEHMSPAAAEKAGCTPCRACHPEED